MCLPKLLIWAVCIVAAALLLSAGNRHVTVAAGDSVIEAAFSPDDGAGQLVVKVIDSATESVRMSAYAFTSPAVVRAVIAAKRRGVRVQIVADERENTGADRSGKARHALNAIADAGVEVRLISAYAIHHDKIIIADGRHVETGSFNFTQAAASGNSENVLVVWNNPALAATYLRHWESRWAQGRDYQPG